MNNLVVFIYTTIGGIIGAAVTQYATHSRDRRTARALVIEHIGKVEAAYAGLEISFCSDTMDINPLPKMEEYLSPLEAAGLIAGVPYYYLTLYINAIRVNYECRRMEAVADGLCIRVIKVVPKLLEENSSLDPVEVKGYVRDVIELAKKMREIAADERPEKFRQSALGLLRIAIWHPLAIRVLGRLRV